MDKLILADTTAIELQASASLSKLITKCADWDAVAVLMPKFTIANISSVQIQTGDGVTVGTRTDLVMQPGNWEVKDDGIYITVSLREKTEIEKRLDAIEVGQAVQGGAIAELSGMVGGEK